MSSYLPVLIRIFRFHSSSFPLWSVKDNIEYHHHDLRI